MSFIEQNRSANQSFKNNLKLINVKTVRICLSISCPQSSKKWSIWNVWKVKKVNLDFKEINKKWKGISFVKQNTFKRKSDESRGVGGKAEIFFFLTYFETICKFIDSHDFTTRSIKFSLPTQRKENCFTRNLEVDEAWEETRSHKASAKFFLQTHIVEWLIGISEALQEKFLDEMLIKRLLIGVSFE